MKKHLIYLSLCFIFVFPLIGQDKESLPRFSIRGTCAIPKIVGSQAYRLSFRGVVDAGINFNLRVIKNITIGVGYQNTLMNQSAFFKDKGLDTRQQVHNGVLRIGVDSYTGPKSFISISLSSGYGLNKYVAVKAIADSLNGKYPTFFNAAFLRPEFSANFLVEDNFAFGLYIAYHFTVATYDPKLNAFDTYVSFNQYRNKAYMNWISFGFGFYFGAKKKNQ